VQLNVRDEHQETVAEGTRDDSKVTEGLIGHGPRQAPAFNDEVFSLVEILTSCIPFGVEGHSANILCSAGGEVLKAGRRTSTTEARRTLRSK
jgi:hypothetical protein